MDCRICGCRWGDVKFFNQAVGVSVYGYVGVVLPVNGKTAEERNVSI